MSLTEEQIEIRKTGIGASEAPMVLGVSPHGGPVALFLRKLGLAEFETTDAQELGNFLEDGIANFYAWKTGARVEKVNKTFRHPKISSVLASPDRWVFTKDGRRKLLQIKLVGTHMAYHWNQGVPDYVQVQCQQEMEVMGVAENDVCAVLGGTEPKIQTIYRDEELGADIAEADRRFWNDYILTRTHPEPDGSEAADQMLKGMFPKSRPLEMIDSDLELDALATDLFLARASAAKQSLIEQKIKARIGDAEGVKGPWWKATWASNAKGNRTFLFKPAKGYQP